MVALPDKGLGVQRGHVRIVDYDPTWPTLFVDASRELRSALGADALGVEHVGSTAVPGLAAKPLLDILVLVRDFEVARSFATRLEPLGLEFRPDDEIPDRHFFRRVVNGMRTHHVSLAEPSSMYARDTIAFRDFLRAHPATTIEYASLKRTLSSRFSDNVDAYIRGKDDFVRNVLKEASQRDA